MTDDRTPPEADPDMTAAELALGLLDGDERAAALRRLLAEPAFAREVQTWRDHFATMFASSPEVVPPADGLARLERALAPAANDDARPAGPWRAIATVSSLVAAALLVVVAVRPGPTPVAPPAQIATAHGPLLVAEIAPVAKGAPVPAVYDAASGELRIASAALGQPGHSAELWVIPAGGAPVSLGVIADAQARSLTIAHAKQPHFAAGATLAVTIEPIGGSPSGKPTGPVVASGALTLI